MSKKHKRRLRVDQTQRRPEKPMGQSKTPLHSKQKTKQSSSSSQAKRTIPFDVRDDILLVGEGDFSFAHSLALHSSIRFSTLIATTFETREQLLLKYPQAATYIEVLKSSGDGRDDLSPDAASDTDANKALESDAEAKDTPREPLECTILYSVDAKKLSSHPVLKRRRFTKIAFNFPHVGGKSTDVNRQVRYNQELVHGFLESCKPILALNGSVLVTLFEGEPYSLWNVRDLARSVGLIVKRSFAFDAGEYPGYRHARTLGNLNVKEGNSVEDDLTGGTARRAGAWRGEERSARTYEFGLKNESTGPKEKKRKRDRQNEASSDDDS